MVPHQAASRKKRGPGRPSKALLSVVPSSSLGTPHDVPPVSTRRRELLALYRRCLTVQARLLTQAEELMRVEVLLQRFLAQDLASVLSAQDVHAVEALLGDVGNEDAADMTELVDQLTTLVSWLRETHLP